MPGNSFGQFFKITSWGESHGKALGVVVDGCPAGIKLNETPFELLNEIYLSITNSFVFLF